jgi:hypothetical protein
MHLYFLLATADGADEWKSGSRAGQRRHMRQRNAELHKKRGSDAVPLPDLTQRQWRV